MALRENQRARQQAELREQAEWRDYVSSIRLASSKLEAGETDAVREILESTPEELRDWEWGYLGRIKPGLTSLSGAETFAE